MSDGMDYLRCIKCGGLEVYLQNDGVTLRCYACKYEWVRRSKLEAKIADLKAEIQGLVASSLDYQDKIADLNEIMNAKQLFIEIISKGSKELEAEIAELERLNKQWTGLLGERNKVIADNTDTIYKLERRIAELEEVCTEQARMIVEFMDVRMSQATLLASTNWIGLSSEQNELLGKIIEKLRGKE